MTPEPDRGNRKMMPSEVLRQLGRQIVSGENYNEYKTCLIAGKAVYYKLLRMEEKRSTTNYKPGSLEETSLAFRIATLQRRLLDAAKGDYVGAQVELEVEADTVEQRNLSDKILQFSKSIRLVSKPLLELLDPELDEEMLADINARMSRA